MTAASEAPSPFDRLLAFLGVRRRFHERSLRGQVVLSNLPMTVTVVMFALLLLLAESPVLHNPLFQAGLAAVAALVIISYVVPWDRLPRGSFWAVPLLSFAAVGLLRGGGEGMIPGLGLLAVFPVFWLAWSGIAPAAAIVLSFLCPLLIVWLPLLTDGTGVTASELLSPVLTPLIMLAIAVSAVVTTTSMNRQQEGLRAKDEALTLALEESRRRALLLDSVLNTVKVGVVVVDARGDAILLNDQQREYHRLAVSADNAEATEAQLQLYGPDRSTPVPVDQRPVRRAIRGESFSDQLVWLGEQAEKLTLSASARPMKDDDGAFAGSVIAYSNVTDLVSALAVKDEFVSNVSHELRTPLTSIIGYLDLVLDYEQELPADVVASLKVALRNSERLLRLVTDLLSTASGASYLEPQRACLADLLRGCFASAAPRAQTAGIVLKDGLPPKLPAVFDSARMVQVADNLLSNAIKYSPDGGVITLRGGETPEGVWFEVQDTGMGMSEEDQKQVFTKFFRTGAVRQTAIPGVGLGMAITESIVQAHGGTISCSSELGVGTTFTVRLPQ